MKITKVADKNGLLILDVDARCEVSVKQVEIESHKNYRDVVNAEDMPDEEKIVQLKIIAREIVSEKISQLSRLGIEMTVESIKVSFARISWYELLHPEE